MTNKFTVSIHPNTYICLDKNNVQVIEMNMRRKGVTRVTYAIILVSIITIAAVSLAVRYIIFPPESQPESPPTEEGGTVVFGCQEQVTYGLDPRGLLTSAENMIVDLTNAALLRFSHDNVTNKMSSEVEPGLAESYTISPDGLTYTFYLREGLKFHDGEPINAEAVKFTLDTILVENHSLAPVSVRGRALWFQGYEGEGLIDEVEVVNEYTIKVALTIPYAPIASIWAAYMSSIISPKAVTELGPATYNERPIGGAGPFKFVEWIRGDHITLEAYDDYYLGRPKINRIIFRFIPDSATRFLELKQGNIDAAYGISPDDITEASYHPDLDVLSEPMLGTGYIYLQTNRSPLDDVRVRRALCYALDRETLTNQLMAPLATVASELLPPGMWPYDPNREWYPYDLEKAKELLAEAGYTEENPLRIDMQAYTTAKPYKPAGIMSEVAAIEMWKEAGIHVSLVVGEYALVRQQRADGDFWMSWEGWTMDFADPDNFIGAGNTPLSKAMAWLDIDTGKPVDEDNPLCVEYYENAKQAAISADHEERVRLYSRNEEIIKDQVPLIPINYVNNVIVARKTLHGLVPPAIWYSWTLTWANLWTEIRK